MFIKRDYGIERILGWKRKEEEKGRGESVKWGQVGSDVVLKRGWYNVWVGCFGNSNFLKLNKIKYINGCRFFCLFLVFVWNLKFDFEGVIKSDSIRGCLVYQFP